MIYNNIYEKRYYETLLSERVGKYFKLYDIYLGGFKIDKIARNGCCNKDLGG